ncbi:MAG: DNA cytosine methyltransferase [Pseudobdellovibrionaceae bacterium]
MKVVSFFAGAGGLDLGFEDAGFDVVWANEYDKTIWDTYRENHKQTILDTRSIRDIPSYEVPDCDGIIGGPPCQSWSEAGALRGIQDARGQLFFEFMRILADKRPKFFLAENVSGMMLPSNVRALNNIIELFEECGYKLSFTSVNASDYGVPQDRKRVFFVGFRNDLDIRFDFPKPTTVEEKVTLRDAIGDLAKSAIPATDNNRSNKNKCRVPNHEYMIGGFSPIYMSRNRVRAWDEVSFTIQAGGRHAPMHPQAPKMKFIEQNVRQFVEGKERLYRRLSVRECARIQTFPDDFKFIYDNIADGYKMIGNAVPVLLGKQIAQKIKQDLSKRVDRELTFEMQAQLRASLNGDNIKERMVELVNAI